jgi:predicted AAA+ superfamily ATPase
LPELKYKGWVFIANEHLGGRVLKCNEETPEYAIVATGSLLEFALVSPELSLPIGRIEIYHFGPFSFDEFLTIIGDIVSCRIAVNMAEWQYE